jgi:hypothetical protein
MKLPEKNLEQCLSLSHSYDLGVLEPSRGLGMQILTPICGVRPKRYIFVENRPYYCSGRSQTYGFNHFSSLRLFNH